MKKIKHIILTAVLAVMTFSAQAQQVNTLYFLEMSPQRHYINPALQPISNMYLSLPVLGYMSMWAGNNSLTVSDVIVNQNDRLMWFANPEAGGTEALLNKMRQSTLIDASAQLNLLSFGFRIKEQGYFHFTMNEKMEGGASLPKGVFNLLLGGGMTNLDGTNTFSLKQLGANLNLYAEVGFGYSHEINEQWTVGGKLKLLMGQAQMSMVNHELALDAGIEEWKLYGDGNIRMAMPKVLPTPASANYEDLQNWVQNFGNNLDFNKDMVLGLLKPAGWGGAIDLGMTYKPIEQLQISAGVTDLGFIYWQKGLKYGYDVLGSFDGVHNLNYSDIKDNQEALTDTIVARLKDVYKTAIKPTALDSAGYARMVTTKLNIGIDANFWDNRVGVGVLSQTRFFNNQVYEEVTLGAAFRPCHWFQLAASYSFLNGRWSNLGAALGITTYEGLGLTLAMDYIPTSYVKTDIENAWGIPYKTKGVNLALGINIVIGHRRDKDHDGIKDKYDLCPDTPRGVKVDDEGCPLDTDGDGVPDYLDDCENTPEGARLFVDENGCEKDTDGDGVPDWLDRCPDTPKEAFGYIDENGCEKDTDGDGVPDWKDMCPDTPAEAKGFVDENGCLLDTDKDGVPDYLDRCPQTPEEARESVDASGCEKDSDADGVPDWRDKCPNTPYEATKIVNAIDEDGCLKDTDGDGVPDYLDACPTIAGTKDNKGCPEIKREVRNLLKQAMQGIQFETNSAKIKASSYPILNQIANVFIDNPSWLVEIQGHTDNVGKAEYNQELSEKRAQSVRDYLIKAGVAADRLSAHGYGMTMPIADNNTAAGRKENRRVEFVVTFEEITYETVKTIE